MSEAERDYWNARYAEGPLATEPSSFLREVAPRFPLRSRVLDVAGGSGRNAVWLAEQGHLVTVVDVSVAGLGLTGRAAAAAGVEVTPRLADLDEVELLPGPWDVILDFHYLNRGLFPAFLQRLRPGGLLVFCQATVRNLERHARPPRRVLLAPGEGPGLLAGFELIVAREGWSAEGRHEFEALARKPG
jgi:tellurite methyltransferase